MRPKPLVLTILDGFGLRDETTHNAIHHAKTPNIDRWLAERPNSRLHASHSHVGLPDGQMGNSEVGHLNLGAGRVVFQDYARIDNAIKAGVLGKIDSVRETLNKTKAGSGTLHIMGLLSPGGVHSHTNHMLEAVRVAASAGVASIQVHGFLDGRDTPPQSALDYIDAFEKQLAVIGVGRIATVGGRYYGMDRDTRWDRVAKHYDLFTQGEGERAESAKAAVEASYDRDQNDEFVLPTLIGDIESAPSGIVRDGDGVWMANFRADRMREICHAFSDGEAFDGFNRRAVPKTAAFLCMTQYDETLDNVTIAFPPARPSETFGEELARYGLTQLRAAETEKYAHVTYFFSGGEEKPFDGEERLMIPSPDVATYDLKPEMSAVELTDALIERIEKGDRDVIVVNYANGDMVGHTGVFEAAVQAVEILDNCLGRLSEVVLEAGGEMLITADHGNADQMVKEETGQPHTAHTTNQVPLIYLGGRALTLEEGRLCDVAPTLMELLGLSKPEVMTGRSLVAR
ncbi:MAG: 2,3-bisphosphoglycerate-independent phosphoglycerate mutase [Magnetococcales bacterium]|nr:2,3-bisphosphoglycerate-independent phosphoglycerate mutase [Magnetococcales bacterium]